MTVFIDIKTGEKVVIIEIINNSLRTLVKVKRLRDKKTYIVPYDELREAN